MSRIFDENLNFENIISDKMAEILVYIGFLGNII